MTMTADHIETLALSCVVAGLLILASSCAHKIVVVSPIVQWTIPLTMDDRARVCVETLLGGWVDPSDAFPLRCVSVGTIRAWLQRQRMAN